MGNMIDKQIHIIHCDEVKLSDEWAPEVVNRIESRPIKAPLTLSSMQSIVGGLIEIYPSRMPKLIASLPDAVNCTEMVINEEGRFTKPVNNIATQIAYDLFGADKVTGKVPETNQIVLKVHGTVFITDNWKID